MSLRSLGSLLARRFSPRAIPRAHALAPAKTLGPATVGRPARSLHSLRDLAAGDGAYYTGGVAAAALVFGFLYVMKGSDESAGEVTGGEEAGKGLAGEEARKQGNMVEAAAAVKEDSDSDFSLENYLAEMTELAAAQKKARHEREVSGKKAAASSEAMTEEDMKEEAAMEARFEEWMGEYGRRYKSEEEKARRYELFKAFAKMVDKATAQSSGGAVFVTNHTADWTEEECRCLYDNGDDWDDYLDHIRSLIDKKNAKAKKAIRE